MGRPAAAVLADIAGELWPAAWQPQIRGAGQDRAAETPMISVTMTADGGGDAGRIAQSSVAIPR